MQRVGDLEQAIRDRVTNRGYEQFSKKRWHRVCSALDNLGDTVEALTSYERSGFGRRFPTQYLRLFGSLQAVYLQQDSIEVLYRDLVGQWRHPNPSTGWTRIRDLRNRIAGHPAVRAGAVARITIGSQHLKIMYWDDDGGTAVFDDVNFRELYRAYQREALAALATLATTLEEKWSDHP